MDTVQVVVHDTFFQRRCSVLEDKKCTTNHIPTMQDRTETRCVPAYNTKCKKVVNTVYRKSCSSMYEKECREVEVMVYRTLYISECVSGSCHQVARQVPSPQPRQKCSSVQKERCREVPDKVEERRCYYVPTQECHTVPVKVAVDVPHQQCHQVVHVHVPVCSCVCVCTRVCVCVCV